jgi:hypothetical protein
MMKLTLNGTWEGENNVKGYDALTEKAAGLVRGTYENEDNICFELKEAGLVQVIYTAEMFKLLGNFYVEPAGETAKFYVTGNAALVGEDKQWRADAVKSESDTLVLDLAAGNYMMKLTLNGTWEGENNVKGYDALTEKAAGLVRGTGENEDNICFELKEAGLVQVIYTAEMFKLLGNFYVEPAGETAKFYVTGDSAFIVDAGLDIAKMWAPNAIKVTEDIYEVSLKAGQFYKMSITTDGSWETKTGYSKLIEPAAGLSTDADNNINFTLAEAGKVKVILTEAGFKVEGNFYVAPVEPEDSMTVYYVNKAGWANVNAFVWTEGELGAYKEWPGEAMAKQAEKINEYDVYSYTFPAKYVNIIFNYDGAQTSDLVWNAEAPYFYDGAWYAKADIPSGETPEEPTLPVVSLAGSWDENWTQLPMVVAADSLSASIKMNLEAKNYDFKIVSDGNWLSKYGADGQFSVNRDWPRADHVDVVNGPNFLLVADAAGEYTFTWTYADSTLVVVFPEKGETPETPKYYLKNNWNGGEEWTWKEMTLEEGGYYTLAMVVFGGTGVDLNTAESEDGKVWIGAEDIDAFDAEYNPAQLGALDTVVFYFDPEEVNQYTGANGLSAWILGKYVAPIEPETPVYSVAGSKAIFGADWDEKNGNEMTLDPEDGLYKLVKDSVTLAAGTTYKFKVVTNHDWTKPSYPDADKELVVAEDGLYKVTITFNAETKAVDANVEKISSVVVEKHYLLVGDAAIANGENWNNDAAINLMTSADEGLTYKLVINDAELKADMTYGYKIVEQGSWTEYYPNAGGDNAPLAVEESGKYTITYTYTVATAQCVVTLNKTGDLPAPTLADGYYLVGTMNSWTPAAEYLFALNPDNDGEYVLNATLAAEDAFKVVYVKEDEKITWYPAEAGDYVVDADHAGAKAIYFRPDYQGGEGWYAGCIYVAPNETTGIEETLVSDKAMKVLRDGQIYILKGDKMYNVMGTLIR